jgi:hypothetical protein
MPYSQDGVASQRTANSPRVPSHPGHSMLECPDFYEGPDGKRKRRHRACKVCSLLQPTGDGTATRKSTKWYCDACSEGEKR